MKRHGTGAPAKGNRRRLAPARGGRRGAAAAARQARPRRSHGGGDSDEIKRANAGKVGRPFAYPESVVRSLGHIHFMTGWSYRKIAEIGVVLLGKSKAPDYTTLCRRVNERGMGGAAGGALVVGDGGRVMSYMVERGSPDARAGAGEWNCHRYEAGHSPITFDAVSKISTGRIVAFRMRDMRKSGTPLFKDAWDKATVQEGGARQGLRWEAPMPTSGFVVVRRSDGGGGDPFDAARLASRVNKVIKKCRSGRRASGRQRTSPPAISRGARRTGRRGA